MRNAPVGAFSFANVRYTMTVQNQFVLYGKKYKNTETTLKIAQKTSAFLLWKNLLENPPKTYKRSNVGKNQKCPQVLFLGLKKSL